MAYKCLFMDNGIYTAQDVNDAISAIISGGVSGYPFGVDALADLNAAIAELSSRGVQYKGTSCLLTRSGNTYKISEGVAIMSDGSQIVFDENGYEIAHESGEYEYVYLERDVLSNTINVVVSSQSGAVGTVPIAEIKEDGTVLDRRCFAKSKISLSAEPENISVVRNVSFDGLGWDNTDLDIDLGFNGWKYMFYNYNTNIKCIKLEDGDTINHFPQDNTGYESNWVQVTRHGASLHFHYIREAGYLGSFDVDIELR